MSGPWPCGLSGHETGKLGTRADAKLAENLPQVERDGRNAHVHPLGGLLVAEPLGGQGRRDALGFRQARPASRGTLG